MEYSIVLLFLVVLVIYVVTRPLLGDGQAEEPMGGDRLATLEAAKEAKYREIRDAELDFRMGKLSEEDYRATDRELRGQAIDILREIDEATGNEIDAPVRHASGRLT